MSRDVTAAKNTGSSSQVHLTQCVGSPQGACIPRSIRASRGIIAEELTRVFRIRKADGGRTSVRELVAVDHLSFSVEPGELFGLLGRNGAGKTTTIRMLSTLLEPTSGRASVAGFDVAQEPSAVRANIGCVLPGERHHYWKLTARENLRFFAAMYRVDPKRERYRIDEVLEIVSLSDRADERVENYSTGMRQRLSLARALLHDPPVLFLDEPTAGLDVHSARALRALVKELASDGRTILLTTHNLQEAQDLCSRVGIIHKGKLVAMDTPEALRRRSNAADIIEIKCLRAGREPDLRSSAVTSSARTDESLNAHGHADEPVAVASSPHIDESPLPLIRAFLEASGATADERPDPEGWIITVKGSKATSLIPGLTAALLEHGWRLTACNVRQPNLEDVFVEITADEEVSPDE